MPLRARPVLLAFCLAAVSATPLARAQEQWSWPEKPKNLQVLPKDFTGKRLAPIMKGFTNALGVRCTYCHVGQEGKPLGTYDFASDQNANKERAREMYRMLGSINEHLKKIQPSGDKRVNMWCNTCHHGKPRPTTLEEELEAAFRRSGATGVVARYDELRKRYYGKDAYDFGEDSLNSLGYDLLGRKEHDAAIAVFRLNAAQFPQSGNAWDSLAEGYMAADKKVLAEIYYRKALELDPSDDNALEKLKELQKPAP